MDSKANAVPTSTETSPTATFRENLLRNSAEGILIILGLLAVLAILSSLVIISAHDGDAAAKAQNEWCAAHVTECQERAKAAKDWNDQHRGIDPALMSVILS